MTFGLSMKLITGCAFILAVAALTSCKEQVKHGFSLVDSKYSGITFRNTLKETVEFNLFNYLYFYNGGGVACGDLNGDGLTDIFFTSNQEEEKLYLNLGNFKFRDITRQAGGLSVQGWTTGVTMADVNDDGRLDIYVSYLGDFLIYKGHNLLLINDGNDKDGIPHFVERSKDFGLDLVGFSTQASFFDYDRDGDLDMFMLNHSVHKNGTSGKSNLRYQQHPLAGDKLMRNDGGKFVDVTLESGVYSSVLGYGLGVVVCDVNLDGWPDIYVGNDFHENDYLYINQKDGTFKEELEKQMGHTSRYTMGVDFADFNNDCFPDLIAMDMLPADPIILKASAAEEPYDTYAFKLKFGYNHQFARNTLQLNNGNNTFSEIALMSGVGSTDWSWATLFADFDLDGLKDIFIANGIRRRSNDLDYINFITADSIQMKIEKGMGNKELAYTNVMPQIKIPNFLFLNRGDSTFVDASDKWQLDLPSYSQGAAYADFDNDGDLDLVINNIEDEAFLYENTTLSAESNDDGQTRPSYLAVSLKGKKGNRFGVGAKVLVYARGTLQMQECMPTRGYQSAVDSKLIFGLGSLQHVDSLVVVWSDGTFQKLDAVAANKEVQLIQQQGPHFDFTRFHRNHPLFRTSTADLDISYKHAENPFVEFNREQLLPHMLSEEGPASAVGDINGDGLDDIFLGNSKRKQASVYLQTSGGTFIRSVQPAIESDSVFEDVSAVFFDPDADGDNDLFVVSGGNEYTGNSAYRNPRLYLNDGYGRFTKSSQFKNIFTNGSCVAIADFDQDGDKDIFLGARCIPWMYGMRPDSYLLANNGKAEFSDVKSSHAPMLAKFGFVKDAIWVDIDQDKDEDLVIASEWSTIRVLINDKSQFTELEISKSGLENTSGWWTSIKALDADHDGDLDLVAGNFGLNQKLKASVAEPVRMYVADFDQNDSLEQVVTHYMDGNEYPFNTRDELTRQMPSLKKRFLSYHKFAEATFDDIFSRGQVKEADQFTVHTFRSSYVENLGGLKFRLQELPLASQISTVHAITTDDFDRDGNIDVLVGGNFYPVNIQMGRNDASYGLILKGDGHGNFKPMPSRESGVSIPGQIRRFERIRVKDKIHYLAIRNNDTVESLTVD